MNRILKVTIIVVVVVTAILLIPLIQSLIISYQADITFQKSCEVMKKAIITLEHYGRPQSTSQYNEECADRTGGLP